MNTSKCDCGATPENRWPHHDDCGLYATKAPEPIKPISQRTGMITKSSELFTGLEYYHVYGHIDRSEPKKEIVVEKPSKYIDSGLIQFRCRRELDNHINRRFAGDCGLDGANSNHNRIFYDLESANQFILKCIREGVRKH